MIKKCSGCGASLQNVDINNEGYVSNLENELCERCFRIRNYNEYRVIQKENIEFINILKNINQTDSLVVLIVDLMNIPKELSIINQYIDNNILFVFTKRDLLPLSVSDSKLFDYVDKLGINYCDKLLISSKNNNGLDELYSKIKQFKTNNNVYMVGFTNAGKSTLINKIIYNYTDLDKKITTSILPSTTLNIIEIPIDDSLTLIDTPGILDDKNIIDVLTPKEIKKTISKKEIKPVTYQLKKDQYLLIEDYLIIHSIKNSNLTFYFSNQLNINRFYRSIELDRKSVKKNLLLNSTQDIVIPGLGFIKISNNCELDIEIIEGVTIFVRNSLI